MLLKESTAQRNNILFGENFFPRIYGYTKHSLLVGRPC
jgi:hypothetical protein